MDIERLTKKYLIKYKKRQIEDMFKNGFQSYNLLSTIYIKEYFIEYENIVELLGKDFLENTLKVIHNINIKEISKENLENLFMTKNIKDKIFKTILTVLFNKTSHLKYYKKDKEIIFKNLESFLEMNLIEFNDNIFKIKEELESVNLIYKEKYEKEQKILLEIVNPIYIEKEYSLARKKQRTIEAFLGPTNSGKTHAAIAKLKESKTGIYLAPLRLLAREIYDDLIVSGVKASLITGEERIIVKGATHICSTIEMLDIKEEYDIAIIDEIQFLADPQRGSTWSKALIGLIADKVIVIGSNNAEYLIKSITERCNDNLEIIKFNRLCLLEHKKEELYISEIEKGDTIIAFSRQDVHSIKEILQSEGFSVSLVYGALPPEVRIEESKKFNEGRTDVLVATDAIGYGLNLNIKRVIFAYLDKYNGLYKDAIDQALFNQIAGRAGRYGRINKGFIGYCGEFDFLKKTKYLKRDEENENYNYFGIDSRERKFYLPTSYINYDVDEIDYDDDDDDDYFEDYNEDRNFLNFLNMSEKLNDNLEMLKTAFYFPEYETLKKVAEESKSEKSLHQTLINYNKIFKSKNPIFSFKFLDKEKTINELDRMNFSFFEKYTLMFAPVNKNNYNFFIDSLDNILNKNKINSKFSKEKSLHGKEELSSKFLLYMWLAQKFPDLGTDYKKIQKRYIKNSYEMIAILDEKVSDSRF